ncbi:ABC transporter permease [Lysobacter yangpyeongensis]|uniref:ABC transporter permease n=1 Tax=Lysobacter yangpyeongensis TaxID=346182 RepID=A0ABW0SRV1_9GAMM
MKQSSLLSDFAESIRRPEFWAYSSWLGIVTKYRRSRLGLLWLVLPSMLYVGGIGYYFAKLQGHEVGTFMPHMGVGYALFRLLSMVINDGSSVLPGHQSFILDGHPRLTDFFLRVLANASFYFCATLPVLAVALSVATGFRWEGLLLALPALALVLCNAAWIAAAIGLLGARFPDIHELMGSVFIFGFILTPILWDPSRAPPGTPHGILMRANPLFHLVQVVRAPLLGESIEPFTFAYLAAFTSLGWLLASYAYRRYARYVPVWV